MSFVATWTILKPDGTADGGEMTVDTAQDVTSLIDELDKDGASAAMVRHDRRPMVADGTGGQVPDHDMTVGVWQGYGYLSFTDAVHDYMVLNGDPRSPAYPAHYVEYDAGTGVPLDRLRAALLQFLETAARPDNVEWKPED
jgi:hypothetical protein